MRTASGVGTISSARRSARMSWTRTADPSPAPLLTAPPLPYLHRPQPAWVAFDRKVLRFNCYFKEAVTESRIENYRVRNCVLYYYVGRGARALRLVFCLHPSRAAPPRGRSRIVRGRIHSCHRFLQP